MDIQLADVTIHVDQKVDSKTRSEIETTLRGIDGVVSVQNGVKASHLFLVEYNPEKTNSYDLLSAVKGSYGNAELVGL
ncbi:MAG: ATP-binding protein [Gammaproteobacteria bacterium]|nr:ATP-binding protein [Gammaproteobacteria bacterium]MCP5407237.1 ATP-binding protein [Chromatiaceae bacterium]MCP5408208.1 ATP-binding protein [Chromatiaceae bacterium]MCP5442019.1 ATP-binding protein [Chromatiaceae bacterium]